MRPGAHRVVRCEVALVDSIGLPEPLDGHVTVLMRADTPRSWLHAADVVGLPKGSGPSAPEVLARLPGCRMVVDLAGLPLLYEREGEGPLCLLRRELVGPVTALLHSWPRSWGGAEAVTEALRRVELSVGPCTEDGPTSTASVRLRGRTVLCSWTALR